MVVLLLAQNFVFIVLLTVGHGNPSMHQVPAEDFLTWETQTRILFMLNNPTGLLTNASF